MLEDVGKPAFRFIFRVSLEVAAGRRLAEERAAEPVPDATTEDIAPSCRLAARPFATMVEPPDRAAPTTAK
jgi:hypothetical protein